MTFKWVILIISQQHENTFTKQKIVINLRNVNWISKNARKGALPGLRKAFVRGSLWTGIQVYSEMTKILFYNLKALLLHYCHVDH